MKIQIKDIIAALEGSAANTDTCPLWVAAHELRQCQGWEAIALNIKTAHDPALIAVAEKLYGALNDIAVEMDLPRHLQADQKIALAAFEAWKLNIEGGR